MVAANRNWKHLSSNFLLLKPKDFQYYCFDTMELIRLKLAKTALIHFLTSVSLVIAHFARAIH